MHSKNFPAYLFAAFLLPCQNFSELENRALSEIQGELVQVFREANLLKDTLVRNRTEGVSSGKWTEDDRKCLQSTEKLQQQLSERKYPKADDKELLVQMGYHLFQQGEFEESRKKLAQAIEAHPTHIEANILLARILAFSKDKSLDREKHLRRVLVEVPINPYEENLQIEAIKALVLDMYLDPLEAQKLMDQWLKLRPDSEEIWLKRAEVSLKLKDAKKLEESLGKIPEPLKYYYSARAAQLRGSQDIAEENAMRYITAEGVEKTKDIEMRVWLGETLISRKVVRSARDLAEKSLLKYPQEDRLMSIVVRAILGGAVSETNPIRDIEKAVALAPDSLEILYRLLDELLLPWLPSLEKPVFPDPSTVKQAEGVIRRISSLKRVKAESDLSVVAQSWLISLKFGKKVFSEADALFNNLEKSVQSSRKSPFGVVSKFSEADFWILGSQIKRARGQFQEAKDVLQKGLTRVKTPEERELILKRL
jgi:thioredoxin-like negative regulator of GroEL